MKLDDLTDVDITNLVVMPKSVANPGARRTPKLKHIEVNYDLNGNDPIYKFSVYVRQSSVIAESFSCGLSVTLPSGEKVTLKRYNGWDHDHPNKIEDTIAKGCHIHTATERYIKAGRKVDGYADSTTFYNDIDGALRLLVKECNVTGIPLPSDGEDEDEIDNNQQELF